MPIVAYVTRTYLDSGSFAQSLQNVGGSGGVAFTLRKANGQNLGMYQTVADAQQAFRQFWGPNRILRWDRKDLVTGVEQHVAIGLPLDPKEIWGSDLSLYVEPYVGVSLDDAATGTIARASDISGSGNPLIAPAGENPTLVQSDANFNGRRTISFDEVATQRFDVPGYVVEVPFTMFLVVNNLAGIGVARAIVTVAGTPILIGTDVAGNWTYDNGAVITGPAATSAPAILVVKQTAAGAEFRVNGTLVGSNASVPADGALTVSRSDGLAWGGNLSLLANVAAVDSNDNRVLQTERYAASRYQ